MGSWRWALVLVVVLGCGDDDAAFDGGIDAGMDAGADATVPTDTGVDPGDSGVDAGEDAAASAVNVLFPRTGLLPEELGVVINEDDPQSVAVGERYLEARGVPAENVVRVRLPIEDRISREAFASVEEAIAGLPDAVQGLAVTWTRPYRVDCMSVTSALAFGFDERFCNTTGMTCGATGASDLFRSDSTRPFADHGARPAMMLAAASTEDALALIDRGVASDGTLPTGDGYLVRTTDTARSVRWPTFEGLPARWSGLSLTYVDNADGSGANVIQDTGNVLFYFTGLARVPEIDTNTYLPGAVADHLTSFGGRVPTAGGQMSVVRWLEAGATGSYGTVLEPCNFQQKFPNVPIFLSAYFRGATLLEAYWSSVRWPGEGLFVGEPLARPFERQVATVEEEEVVLETNAILPGDEGWVVESADSADGPWTVVLEVTATEWARQTVRVPRAPWLRLRR
ncbi:MAG: TIGR03790 family protein [Myxococcota bacterium]